MEVWYFVNGAGERQGPIDRAAMQAAVGRGEIHAESLVWREGLAQWQPAHTQADQLGVRFAATPASPPMPPLPPAAAPAESAAAAAAPMTASAASVVYGGFWRRFAALFIDNLLLSAAFYAVLFVAIVLLALLAPQWLDNKNPAAGAWLAGGYLLLALLYYVGAAFYYSLQESSQHQATVGKRAVGIKVTDLHGARLTFRNALGRWFAASLSYFTIYIGFLLAAFTERKQALHDMIAGTLVVDRWAFSAQPERQREKSSATLIAVVAAGGLLLVVMMLGILAAIAIPAYQDYVQRSHVHSAINQAAPLKATIAEFIEAEGRCPSQADGEAGLRSPEQYATTEVSRVDVGTLEAEAGAEGGCAIELTLFGQPAVNGKHVWLVYGDATGAWTCRADLKATYLPATCRE